MKSYRVFLYSIVWLKTHKINAANPLQAAAKAQALLPNDKIGSLLNREFFGDRVERAEFSEALDSILVDQVDTKGEAVTGFQFCADGKTSYSEAREAMVSILNAHPDRKLARKAAALAGINLGRLKTPAARR